MVKHDIKISVGFFRIGISILSLNKKSNDAICSKKMYKSDSWYGKFTYYLMTISKEDELSKFFSNGGKMGFLGAD